MYQTIFVKFFSEFGNIMLVRRWRLSLTSLRLLYRIWSWIWIHRVFSISKQQRVNPSFISVVFIRLISNRVHHVYLTTSFFTLFYCFFQAYVLLTALQFADLLLEEISSRSQDVVWVASLTREASSSCFWVSPSLKANW